LIDILTERSSMTAVLILQRIHAVSELWGITRKRSNITTIMIIIFQWVTDIRRIASPMTIFTCSVTYRSFRRSMNYYLRCENSIWRSNPLQNGVLS